MSCVINSKIDCLSASRFSIDIPEGSRKLSISSKSTGIDSSIKKDGALGDFHRIEFCRLQNFIQFKCLLCPKIGKWLLYLISLTKLIVRKWNENLCERMTQLWMANKFQFEFQIGAVG